MWGVYFFSLCFLEMSLSFSLHILKIFLLGIEVKFDPILLCAF